MIPAEVELPAFKWPPERSNVLIRFAMISIKHELQPVTISSSRSIYGQQTRVLNVYKSTVNWLSRMKLCLMIIIGVANCTEIFPRLWAKVHSQESWLFYKVYSADRHKRYRAEPYVQLCCEDFCSFLFYSIQFTMLTCPLRSYIHHSNSTLMQRVVRPANLLAIENLNQIRINKGEGFFEKNNEKIIPCMGENKTSHALANRMSSI